MRGFIRIPLVFRRFLLGAFAAYLLGLLGYIAPSHQHEDSGGHSATHQDCQLCQVSAQPFTAAEPMLCPETPAGPARLVEAVWEPILACRHQPFASRAPPYA